MVKQGHAWYVRLYHRLMNIAVIYNSALSCPRGLAVACFECDDDLTP